MTVAISEKMRYFLELSYNGTNYRGWQRQKNAPSVQQTIEEALTKLLGGPEEPEGSGDSGRGPKAGPEGSGKPIEVTGVGRTDTGVHAAYYVAHFDHAAGIADRSDDGNYDGRNGGSDDGIGDGSDGGIGDGSDGGIGADFLYHANSILPPDIALKSIRRVADDAHVRFDAREREYTYYILPFKDPFRAATAWQYSVPLDMEAMNEAAAHLTKVSDFTTFAKLGGGNKTNLCRVMSAQWRREADGALIFTIRADRFLRNMVRAIVGTLVDVGRGKITPVEFARIVDARDLSRASGGAPAKGLFLTDIKY